MPNKIRRKKAKLISEARARKLLKRRLKSKQGKSKKGKALFGKSKVKAQAITRVHEYWDYKKAKVPKNFSFLLNPEGVSTFISQVKSYFIRKRKVFIVMKNVEVIDNSAIVILLSIMVRFRGQNIPFDGDFPNNNEVYRVFLASGFFHTLRLANLRDLDKYRFGKHSIYTHAQRNVFPELSETIMLDIGPELQNKAVVYKGLHRTLIELMQNSFNHATPYKEGEKHWWMSVNAAPRSKVVRFSFIDYGVGIFESLDNKEESSKWYDWPIKLANYFKFENNCDILKLILEGELHKTVTGQYFRGKGLPGIKQALDRKLISKLHTITNDVYANVEENIYQKLSHNFEGTFVYWEISDQTPFAQWTTF